MHRFPDFLVIGAMKSGTTSFFFDLSKHPSIWLAEKESNDLLSDEVLSPQGRLRYARKFERATPDQLCGEVSSAYSKLPDLPGVPARARNLCGAGLKVIYLVREPVARIVSHHYHDFTAGQMDPQLDRAVRDRACLIDYSSYGMQLEPWVEIFGREQVRVVRFESYIRDRNGELAEVFRFLGLEPLPESVDADQVHNRSRGKPAPVGSIWRWSRGGAYRRWLRPLIPPAARSRLAGWLLPKAPPPPAPPTGTTVDWLLERLEEDSTKLQEILGLEEPMWDPSAVRSEMAQRQTDSTR